MSDELSNVVREQGPFVWRSLRYLGVPEPQLEDLCQEVFIVIMRRLASFEGRSMLRTWVYGICCNVARSAARKRARARERPGAEEHETPVAEQQTQILAAREVYAVLQETLLALPEETRMVFVLFELENLPMEEVARSVGCKSSTAYSRLYAARTRVYGALQHAGLLERGQTLAEVM